MKIIEVIVLLLLFFVLGFGTYILWLNLPGKSVEYQPYATDYSGMEGNGIQFYPNMRYKDRVISYYIEPSCSDKKKLDVEESFSFLSVNTILRFTHGLSNDAEIKVLCSNIAPTAQEAGHFVAGEGGPSEVINASVYSVILSGKVSLYRDDKCGEPKVALHEILHALGFDHNYTSSKSIMYPTTQCDQTIDKYIIDKINSLYSVDSKTDLAIEKVNANKTGRYLSFEIVVINIGLKDALDSTLNVIADGENVKDFNLGKIDIGTKKVLTVQNIKIPSNSEKIRFEIKNTQDEVSFDNNVVEVGLTS